MISKYAPLAIKLSEVFSGESKVGRLLCATEFVKMLIDAAKEELRAEMATNVLGPAEDGVAEGGETE